MWRDNDVSSFGEGVKHLRHPVLGPITFEYSAFAVDGRPDLGLVVYNPLSPADPRPDRVADAGAAAVPRDASARPAARSVLTADAPDWPTGSHA